jgi:hypothetical protein
MMAILIGAGLDMVGVEYSAKTKIEKMRGGCGINITVNLELASYNLTSEDLQVESLPRCRAYVILANMRCESLDVRSLLDGSWVPCHEGCSFN